MRKTQFLSVLLIGGLLGTGLVACEKQGPAEKAGEKLDNAAKDVKEGAEEAGEKIQNAAEEAKDKID
jgi:hypothetical protein